MLYFTLLYYILLYSTIQYYTILYYTLLYCTLLYYTILYYTILLFYSILYYSGFDDVGILGLFQELRRGAASVEVGTLASWLPKASQDTGELPLLQGSKKYLKGFLEEDIAIDTDTSMLEVNVDVKRYFR